MPKKRKPTTRQSETVKSPSNPTQLVKNPHEKKKSERETTQTIKIPAGTPTAPTFFALQTIGPALIQQWFAHKEDFIPYKKWLADHKETTSRLKGLTATLTSIQESKTHWLPYHRNHRLHSFIGQVVALFDGEIGAITSNKQAKQIAQAAAHFLDTFLALPPELLFLTRFNPAKLFHLLKTLGTKGSLSTPGLASMVGSIGLLAQRNLFFLQALDTSKETITFANDWENGLRWLEESCNELALTPTIINQLLTSFATMAATHRLPIPIPPSLIYQLLSLVVESATPHNDILTALQQLHLLVDHLALTDITTFDVNLLTNIIDKAAEEKSTPKTTDTTYAAIVKEVTHIFCAINTLAKPPKRIETATLIKALKHPSLTTPSSIQDEVTSALLLAIGKILQSGHTHIEESSALQEIFHASLRRLNHPKNASQMSLPHIGRTLYACVVSKKLDTWLEIKDANHLVDEFFRKLQKEPAIDSKKITMAIQQFAEYLGWAKQPLKETITGPLKRRKPAIRETSLQHTFVKELQAQPWFKARFIPCEGEENIEEIFVANQYVCVDVAFKDKKTGKIFIIDIDGYTHAFRQPQDQRRDAYLKALKKPLSNEGLVADIIRIPIHTYPTVEKMLEFAEDRLIGEQSIAKQSFALEQKKEKTPLETKIESRSPGTPKKTAVPPPSASMKQLYRAIDDQKPIQTLLAQLKKQRAFEKDTVKADVLAHAVSQFDPQPSILSTLIDTLGNPSITAPTTSGESPLVKAAISGKVATLNIFLEKTTPSQRQSNLREWQAALSEAHARKKENIVNLLTRAEIALPIDKALAAEALTPKPTQEEKILRDNKNHVHHFSSCLCGVCQYQQKNLSYAKHLETLASAGHAVAQYIFAGQFYNSTLDKPIDEEQFLFWLEKSAQTYAFARYALGSRYLKIAQEASDSKTAKAAYQKAFEWHQLAANAGIKEAQYNLGRQYYQGEGVERNYVTAFQWFKSAAEKDYGIAHCTLGVCYQEGHGTARNYQEAIKWFQKALEQHHIVKAHYYLGMWYYDSHNEERDFENAVKHLQLAAKEGITDAQYDLAVCYLRGNGVKKNPQEAFRWFKSAARQGSREGQYILAQLYHHGEGVEKDRQESFKWFKLAAKGGKKEAQFQVGAYLLNGIGDEKEDKEGKALYWLRLSAEQGYQKAIDFFKTLTNDDESNDSTKKTKAQLSSASSYTRSS